MTEHDPSAWLASIAEIFDRLGVDWTVVGALAANRYRATPRFTTDLDTGARPRLCLHTSMCRGPCLSWSSTRIVGGPGDCHCDQTETTRHPAGAALCRRDDLLGRRLHL